MKRDILAGVEDGRPIALAAIVLAGGRSSRMGSSKPLIDWHGTPLLTRVVRVLQRVADPVVVVHGRGGGDLPPLPPGVETAGDAHPDRGPLEGIAAGMRQIGDRAAAVYVSAADLPFLHPDFVRRVAACLGPDDVALPIAGGHEQPLAAVYRLSVLAEIERLLAAGTLRPAGLWDRVRLRRLAERELVALDSLRGVNNPGELEAARARPLPLVRVEVLRRGLAAGGPRELRAATLGEVLAVVSVPPDPGLTVAVDGRTGPPDPDLPLVDGDRLVLAGP